MREVNLAPATNATGTSVGTLLMPVDPGSPGSAVVTIWWGLGDK